MDVVASRCLDPPRRSSAWATATPPAGAIEPLELESHLRIWASAIGVQFL